jgi:hypothetical protein
MAKERQGQVPAPSTHMGIFVLGLEHVLLQAQTVKLPSEKIHLP